MKKIVFLTALFAACYLPNAYAHALYVFAQYDGQTLSGKSYYSDMTPAAETYLEVFRSGVSDPVLTGKTDRQGAFKLSIADVPHTTLKVVVAHTSAENQSGADLMLLREDIAHLKDKIYLHDILGGIGYIVGIAGLIALRNARKIKQGRI